MGLLTMRTTTIIATVAFASLTCLCEARNWKDVVDPSIFVANAIDKKRLQNSLERDPFLPYDESAPTLSPTSLESEDDEAAPTSSPTARYQNIIGNGGCPVGKSLFEIRMADSWGDGWDGTKMRIVGFDVLDEEQNTGAQQISTNEELETVSVSELVVVREEYHLEVFNGGLQVGDEGYEYVCLEKTKCYHAIVEGGEWEEEIKWEIRRVNLGQAREERENGLAIAKGLAPTLCQFSVPDVTTGEQICLTTCGPPSKDSPSAEETNGPTSSPTRDVIQSEDKPTNATTGMPSDAPTAVPT